MTAYRRVYDSRHLQTDCKKTGISSGTLLAAIELGLPLPFLKYKIYFSNKIHGSNLVERHSETVIRVEITEILIAVFKNKVIAASFIII